MSIFKVEVKYTQYEKDVELIRSFRSFEELGVWISNNYDEIRIIDLIVYVNKMRGKTVRYIERK